VEPRIVPAHDEGFNGHPVGPAMVKVGLTGATGFIGGALVPLLAQEGYDLALVDDRSGPLRVESPQWPAEAEDFSSAAGLLLLSDCDVVLHLGAVSGVMACVQDPAGAARVNVEGTRRLVEACAAHRIALAFASSFAVVGRPERLPVTEQTPARPTHEYARQKAAGERIVDGLGEQGPAPSAVVRMSNVYGTYTAEGRTIAKGNVISLFVGQALDGHLRVNAPGTQRRNFVHLDDVLAHWVATVRFLRAHPSPSAYRFNCASDESYSVLEVAEKVVQHWKETRPGTPPPTVDIVPNPRAAIELVDPEFSVRHDQTERLLGVTSHHRVDDTIRNLLPPFRTPTP
jgi:UDP-glucose 4-epimerase